MKTDKRVLTLIAKGGKDSVKADEKIVTMSTFIYNQAEESDDGNIYLPNIGINELKLVAKYAKMHKYKPVKINKPIQSSLLHKNLANKDYNFVKKFTVGDLSSEFI